MEKREEEEYVSVNVAAGMIGIRADCLRYHIGTGALTSRDGRLSLTSVEEIRTQKEKYVSLQTFLKAYDNDRFHSRLARNREKYIDFLEKSGYFGIAIKEPNEIFFSIPGRDEFFILKEDAAFLDYKSRKFFEDFGVSEKEKAYRIMEGAENRPCTLELVRKFLACMEDEKNIYTPSLTDFLGIVFEMPDARQVSDDDIIGAIESAATETSKQWIADFFAYAARYEKVAYHSVSLQKKENKPDGAYSYEEFLALAKALFNAAYDKSHRLTEKALERSGYAEMWMFLACHYVCGWRASDICDGWAYPNLKGGDNPFGVHTETLKEDILNERISDAVYERVALYVIRRIEMASNAPGKTGRGRLRSEIVPELRAFFGKLTLIAEYHHLRSGEGYMKARRINQYRNWVACREFFGEEVFAVTGMRHISSRRLNKSYLQGLEETARSLGNPTLVAHAIASYARNHADVDTTAIYLRDHGLTGESAGVVLFMMMQRGVFGVSLYHALLAAFPGAFERLTAKEQSRLMERIPLSAYELELAGSAFVTANEMSEKLAEGNAKETMDILMSMFSIAQGRGRAKDEGVYCKRKALGLCCENPIYESCVANLCPHHVFTSEGIPALGKVIRNYAEKARRTGNGKYRVALQTYIIPAFQETVNAMIREMSETERDSVRKLLEESLHG